MSSLNLTSRNQFLPSPAQKSSPHPGLKGKSILEVLPRELKLDVIESLMPHQRINFALTSKEGLGLFNESITPTPVPFPARVTNSRAGEWARQFQALPPEMQNVLEATAGVLPCPDIFSTNTTMTDIEALISHINRAIAAIRDSGRGGSMGPVEPAWLAASDMAKKLGVDVPLPLRVAILDALIGKARGYIFMHCHPEQIGDAAYDAVRWAQKINTPLPQAACDEFVVHLMHAMTGQPRYASDASYFRYIASGLNVALQFTEKAKRPFPRALCAPFLNACRTRAQDLRATGKNEGANEADALAQQASLRFESLVDFA